MYPKSSVNIISHIPHSSTSIPEDVRGQFVLSEEEIRRELIVMTDHFTDELFHQIAPGAQDIIFAVSRLVVDPERFEVDADEPMVSAGMGVIYHRTSAQKPLRRQISNDERQHLIDNYYRPHHRRLNRAAGEALQHSGRCLVLDCHSYPAKALPYEINQGKTRPEICIGTDKFHTPGTVADMARSIFQGAGFSVALNEPFAGALVPNDYYNIDERVLALMIEVRRDLYMNEATGNKLASFSGFQQRLRACIHEVVGVING